MAWLPVSSVVCALARLAIHRSSEGAIILSWLATMYQVGLFFHAGWVIFPVTAPSPHGFCDAAIKSAVEGSMSAANASRNLVRSPAWGANTIYRIRQANRSAIAL